VATIMAKHRLLFAPAQIRVNHLPKNQKSLRSPNGFEQKKGDPWDLLFSFNQSPRANYLALRSAMLSAIHFA
jgi:hypothetical protein